ncbi:hypothetical protein PtA15_5A509 [Puccinia triticina]|uniref:Peroxisomal membrane protein PEX16 n=1 Tax=Puccinia triticina TaxID=208348 RepID=A0ABY7CI78_9BASI|nr:uncharacterized protein PtA15_5A509 [Puccinia triticina]WAQ84936.1 hypothetical protein PtA15_5A509 [Puccinia triticina]
MEKPRPATTTLTHESCHQQLAIQPDRIQLIKETDSQPTQKIQKTLPFTTSISKFVFRLLSHDGNRETGLINKLIGYLSLLLIRELATLEDLFVKSPIYRLLRFLTPSILPKSSTYPFLLTLILGGIQLRKLWKHQQELLLNLLVSLAPLLNTLRVLTHIQVHHDRIHSRTEDEDSSDHQELRRWTMYWLVYCSLINLESLKIPTYDLSHLSPIISRPTIYPNTIPSPKENVPHGSYSEKLFYLFKNLKTQSSKHLFNLLPNVIKPATTSESLKNIPPRLPIESFDLQTRPNTFGRPVQVLLPEYLFGKDRRLYGILKLGFLRWCSSEQSRGSEMIWTHVLAPIVSVIGRSSSGGGQSRTGQMKIVKVTISAEDDGREQDPTDTTSGPSSMLPHRPPTRSHPPANLLEPRPEELPESPASSSVRRIKSDPTPARWEPTGRPAHALADPDARNIHSDPAESSPAPSTILDPNENSPLSKSSPYHSSLRQKRANSLSKHLQPIDFKTPENAWDTISFVG